MLCGVGCHRFGVVLVRVPYGPRILECMLLFLCYGVCKVVCLLVAGGAIDLCGFQLVCRCMCLWG